MLHVCDAGGRCRLQYRGKLCHNVVQLQVLLILCWFEAHDTRFRLTHTCACAAGTWLGVACGWVTGLSVIWRDGLWYVRGCWCHSGCLQHCLHTAYDPGMRLDRDEALHLELPKCLGHLAWGLHLLHLLQETQQLDENRHVEHTRRGEERKLQNSLRAAETAWVFGALRKI